MNTLEVPSSILQESVTNPIAAPSFRQRAARRLSAPLVAIATISPFTAMALDAAPAHADSSLEFTVTDTDGGVYARNSPHENDTDRVDGDGAYDGDVFEDICGVTNGDGVGPYNNHTWHFGRDKNRPDSGTFWINDHFLDTGGVANQLAPGEAYCGDAPGDIPVQPPQQELKYRGGCKTNWLGALLKSSEDSVEGMPWSQAWAQEGNNDSNEDVCVGAMLSNADGGSTRHIGEVGASSPATEPGGCAISFEIEVWGDGFYKKSDCTEGHWDIDKDVQLGTYICAAVSDATDTEYYKDRADADAATRAGKVQLGKNDPQRAIACVGV
jgi:hypothetical protein